MQLPFRTNKTWLHDDHLVLLDVIFRGGITFGGLRGQGFLERWNFGYAHNFGDDELRHQLQLLCEQGVLTVNADEEPIRFRMTANGGDLWSQERCPVWERYCTERYKTTARGRILMSVTAVSPTVRDEFLAVWPFFEARLRTAMIADAGLIDWHPFGHLYAGVAIYDDQPKDNEECQAYQQHSVRLERERIWWRTVRELQRFVPTTAQSE